MGIVPICGQRAAVGLAFAMLAMLPLAARAADANDDLPNPPELRSADGVLRGTLTVAPAEVTVRGRKIVSNVINGNYMAPTLRVRRGDVIRLKAVNEIGKAQVNIDGPQPTNVHYHGMDVSPKLPNGDNVFIRIKPDQSLRYDVPIPSNHPLGLHWYHAHVHTYVDDQIGSGVSGMLIVDGFIPEQYPELVGLRQRVMVFKDFTFPGFKDGDARAKSLNGYANPPIKARPGEWQVWELGNLGADAFFDMKLDGHDLWLIERDGILVLNPVRVGHVFMPPGSRATVAVRAGAAGEYAWRHLNVDTGPAGDPNPATRLGTFIVSGSRVPADPSILQRLRKGPAQPNRIQPNSDTVAKLPVNRTRYIDFSESANGNTFYINDKEYKESRVDTTTRVGQVERWVLRNYSQELHVFHIHQTEFLITKFSGSPDQALGGGLRDVVNLPYAVSGKPGVVEVKIPFTNPIIAGEFVYHCHLVQHEDAGMMANIRVLPKQSTAELLWDKLTRLTGLDLPPLRPEPSPTRVADFAGEICSSGEATPVALTPAAAPGLSVAPSLPEGAG